ncbi:hypothetical protein COCC4DRAFT_138910, partial [Bipolaris maydis ATCC 48331]
GRWYTRSSNSCSGRLNWSGGVWGTARAPSALVVWTMQSARASAQANRAILRYAETCRLRDAWSRIDCGGGSLSLCLAGGGYGWMGIIATRHLVKQKEFRRVHACSPTLLVGACARAVK